MVSKWKVDRVRKHPSTNMSPQPQGRMWAPAQLSGHEVNVTGTVLTDTIHCGGLGNQRQYWLLHVSLGGVLDTCWGWITNDKQAGHGKVLPFQPMISPYIQHKMSLHPTNIQYVTVALCCLEDGGKIIHLPNHQDIRLKNTKQ